MALQKLPFCSLRFLRAIGNSIDEENSSKRRLYVLNYHRILPRPDPLLGGDPDLRTFRWQMKLLAKYFNVLPVPEAVSALNCGALPPRAVSVTFDDGYKSVFDLALPVLKEFRIPATVFVTSGLVGNGNMWNDKIIEAVRRLPAGELDLRELHLKKYHITAPRDKKTVVLEVVQHAKYLSTAHRNDLVERLTKLAGIRDMPSLMLTRDMLLSLVSAGVDIGAHSVTHPILANLDDETARREIADSKRQLEELVEKEVAFFAYPNGKAELDFDGRHMQMVREAGYSGAFACGPGAVSRSDGLFRMPRGLPWDSNPLLFGGRIMYWLAR